MTLGAFQYRSKLVSFCREHGLLDGIEFQLVDVGASGGIDLLWRQFEPGLRSVGFDPLVSEVERLNSIETNPKIQYVAAWVGNGDRVLPATAMPETAGNASGPSSVFAMTSAARAAEKTNYSIIKNDFNRGAELRLAERRLSVDQWLAEGDFGQVDVLKCDVDGFDFEVFVGAHELLTSAQRPLALITEAQFHERRGQRGTAFGDIDRLIRDYGYRLFDIDITRYSRGALPDTFLYDLFAQTVGGQAIQCDAVYLVDPVMDPAAMQHLLLRNDPRVFLKLSLLYDSFGLPGCVADLLLKLRQMGWTDVAGLDITQALDELTPRNIYGATTHAAYLAAFDADPRRLFPSALASSKEDAQRVWQESTFDWTLDLQCGTGCYRRGLTIVSPQGVGGHMAYGPYKALPPGAYKVGFEFDVRELGTSRLWKKPNLTIEVVRDEEAIAQFNVPVRRRGKIYVERAFALQDATGTGLVQLRITAPQVMEIALHQATITFGG